MDASTVLVLARRSAGLTQRQLADRAAVRQSTVLRIERGLIEPRVSTLDRLLRACGLQLTTAPLTEDIDGIDRTLIRELLRRTPTERVQAIVNANRFAEALAAARPRAG